MSTNAPFKFGEASSARFEFDAPGDFDTGFPKPERPAPEAGPKPPGPGYVTLAQYETVETRLDALEAEREKDRAAREQLKKTVAVMEAAYKRLEEQHEAAAERIKS